MTLKNKTVSGVLWNFTELMLRRGVTGLTTLILAWFLTPKDFGMLAMMTVFLAFADVIVDAGFSQALIRKKNVTQRELSTSFYANVFIAVLAYTLLFYSASFIALFYEQSELEQLIPVAGLAILFNALAVVQQAILSREMKFKLQLQVTLPAAMLSSLLAIVCAYLGLGVWALIVQITSQSLFTSALYWRLRLWLPDFDFGWKEFRDLFSFGGFLLLEQMARVPFKNMYVIVIAKVYTGTIAGLYFFSEKVRDLFLNQLVQSVQKVTYPALSQIQSDTDKLKSGYRQVLSVTTFLVFPMLIFLAALVDGVFDLLLPKHWGQASQYLQLLCIASLMNPLHAVNLNILKVKGRSDLIFYLGVFKKVTAILIFIFTFKFGIVAIILGQVINSIISYIPNSYYSKRLINYSVREQLSDFFPSLILASLVGLLIWWVQSELKWHSLLELFILASSGLAVYIWVSWVTKTRALELVVLILKNKYIPQENR